MSGTTQYQVFWNNLIGEGSTGKIFTAKKYGEDKILAAKVFHRENSSKDAVKEEFELVNKLQHDSIINYYVKLPQKIRQLVKTINFANFRKNEAEKLHIKIQDKSGIIVLERRQNIGGIGAAV